MDKYHSFVKKMHDAELTVHVAYFRYRSLFMIDPVTLEFLYCKPSKMMRYYRRTKRHSQQFMPYPKGGMCVLSVKDGDKIVAQGISKCMLCDNFEYKEARNRAVDNIGLTGFTFPVKADAKVITKMYAGIH